MILKYVGCPEPPDSPRYYELPGLVIGGEYEIAEIFEMEGHVMVQRPGETRWPCPGSPVFGIHPEWFEPTKAPIPIVSCGFRYHDYLCDFFGVILDRPEYVDVVGRLKQVDCPDEDEEFDDWQRREAPDFSTDTALALYEFLRLPVPVDFGVCKYVFLADGKVNSPFAYAGAHLAALARHRVTTDEFGQRLGQLLYSLEIRGFEVADIDLGYWEGTRGGDRLINASPDGGLIYGTDNLPEMLDHGEWPGHTPD